jgi:AcrR family transcriptional regulator
MPSGVAGTRARSKRPSPRERLLKAADELFYAEGINTVGIDRVIDRADVARASLYSTFGSKDELIRGYLEHRMEILKARLRAAAEARDDPREALLSVFGVQAATFARPGFQGCAFNRASAEAPRGSAAYEVPRAYRQWLHEFLRDLAAATGAPDPDQLASQIHLLYDGAMLAASLDGNPGVAAASRSAAEVLLDAALLDAALLRPAVSPGAGSGRHRKQDQSAADPRLQV